jgi:hypothetical protein
MKPLEKNMATKIAQKENLTTVLAVYALRNLIKMNSVLLAYPVVMNSVRLAGKIIWLKRFKVME